MNIKAIIKEKGFTLERIAEKWQPKASSKGALSKIINNNPTVATLHQIADIIGCHVADFFRDELEPDALSAVVQYNGKILSASTLRELEDICQDIKKDMGQ